MKKYFILFCFLLFCYASVSAQTFSGGGSGTESSPWRLGTRSDIDTLAKYASSSSGKYYQLFRDIGDATSPVTTMIGTEFVSQLSGIGNCFQGNFDGNNYSIYVNLSGSLVSALFAFAENCKISNLTLAGNVSGTTHVGGIVGLLRNSGEIINCKNKANISGANSSSSFNYAKVGGIVCEINTEILSHKVFTIKNCSNTGNLLVAGSSCFGGILGSSYALGTDTVYIINCYNDSCEFSNTYSDFMISGGILGTAYSSSVVIDSCYNNVKLSFNGYSADIYVGGIVGGTNPNLATKITIRNSKNMAKINTTSRFASVGGIFGFNDSRCTLTVVNCLNLDSINVNVSGSNNEAQVGGILGLNLGRAAISHCRNYGATYTTGSYLKVAGIVGDNDAPNSHLYIDTCFNYVNHTSMANGSGLTHMGGILGDNFGYAFVTGCRNSGDILGYGTCNHYDLGGIVGDNMAKMTVTRCTNVGTIYTTQNTFYSSITLGGIVGFGNDEITVNNCHNAGLVKGVGNVGGIIGATTSGGTVSYNLNNGCIVLNNNSVNNSKGAIIGSKTSGNGLGSASYNYYDKQMSIYGGINNTDTYNQSTGKLTNELIGTETTFGSGLWHYNTGLYPMLYDDTICRVAASPAFLYNTSASTFNRHNAVSHHFTVSTTNGISWTSSNTSVVYIAGTSATIGGLGVADIYPNLGGIKRTVPITTIAPNYILVTRPDTVNNGTTTPDTTRTLGKVIIRAIPANCYEFVSWEDKNGNTISVKQIDTITFDRDTLLIATFQKIKVTLTLIKNPEAGGEVYGGGSMFCEVEDTIIAVPNYCYVFINWTDSITGEVVSKDVKYPIALNTNRTIVANFKKMENLIVKLVASPADGGGVSGDDTTNCSKQKIIISAIPNDCFKFLHWKDGATGNVFSEKALDTITAHTDFATNINLIAIFETDSILVTTNIYPKGAEGRTNVNGTSSAIKIGCGNDFIITATPISYCYKFLYWTNLAGDIVSKKLTDTLSSKNDISLTANFFVDTFMLILEVNPDGYGYTTGGGKILCGDKTVISAVPNRCKRFVNWTDAQTGKIMQYTQTDTIMLSTHTHLIANFVIDTFNLVLSSSPVNAGYLTGQGRYECGTNVSITAKTTKDCFTFSYWENVSTGEKIFESDPTIEITSNMNYIAHFLATDTFYLTLQYSPADIIVSLSGEGLYSTCDYIAECDINIYDNCTHFRNWTDKYSKVISNEINPTIMLHCDSILIANFDTDMYAISLTPAPIDAGTVNKVMYFKDTLRCNSEFIFEAKANKGWKFTNWTDSLTGQIISINSTDELNITSETKLIANFEIGYDSVTITLIANPTDGGELEGDGKYPVDAIVQLKATPNEGYVFTNWTENGIQLDKKTTFTLVAVRDMVIYGNFRDISSETFTVSLSSNLIDAAFLTGSGEYIPFDTAKIGAVPISGYYFKHWQTADGTIISESLDYAFQVTSDTHLVAYFYVDEYVITLSSVPSYMGNIEGGTTGFYPKGYIFELTAVPTAVPFDTSVYNFVSWTNEKGDILSKNKDYKFIVSAPAVIIANFTDDTSIMEYDSYNIYIFPNPVSNTLNIMVDDNFNKNTEISITDVLGRERINILTNNMKSDNNNYEIDISDFSPGVYFVRFNSGDRFIVKKMIVK